MCYKGCYIFQTWHKCVFFQIPIFLTITCFPNISFNIPRHKIAVPVPSVLWVSWLAKCVPVRQPPPCSSSVWWQSAVSAQALFRDSTSEEECAFGFISWTWKVSIWQSFLHGDCILCGNYVTFCCDSFFFSKDWQSRQTFWKRLCIDEASFLDFG